MANSADGNEVLMTPLKGLLVLAGVVIVVAGFIALNGLLGVHEYWGGFLFLLYWAGLEHMEFRQLPHCIAGALVGLAMGWLMTALPGWFGETTGMLVFVGLVLVLIYCQVMSWAPIAINMVTMLYLTVCAIPAVQANVDLAHVLIALLLAIAYFAGLVGVATLFQQKKTAPASMP